MACISRFATAILSGETELALGTIRVKYSTWPSLYRVLKRVIFWEVVVLIKIRKNSNKHGPENAYFLRSVGLHLPIVSDDATFGFESASVTDKVNIEETNTIRSQSLPKGRGMHCYGRTSRWAPPITSVMNGRQVERLLWTSVQVAESMHFRTHV